jgi:hypothetical protein
MKIKIVVFTVFCTVLLGSCVSSAQIVFDESIPPAQSANISFYPGIHITSYNGHPVPTRRNILLTIGFVSEWRNVRLPAGQMEFELAVEYDGGYVAYVTRNARFRYTFQPGGEYTIFFAINEDDIWGVSIYRGRLFPPVVPNPRRTRSGFIAFVPFEGASEPLILQ